MLGAIKQATNTTDEERITTEEERMLVTFGCHMCHNKATVVTRVPRCFHAADAKVADSHCL